MQKDSVQKNVRPQVSWLLCTNRYDDLLHRAIRSCLEQSMQDFELLLMVNGPDVERLFMLLSRDYINENRVHVVSTPVCLLNFSLSFGLHLAKAPFVARMDGDDVSHPERLECQLAYMEANPSVAVLGSFYNLVDENGLFHGRVDLPVSDQDIRKSLQFRNPICHPSVMLRREVILSVGGYLGGRNAEDYDLWLRLAMTRKWKFANLHQPLLSYNVAPPGLARRSREAYANVASAQLRQFLVTRNTLWLIGAVVTVLKFFFRADRS